MFSIAVGYWPNSPAFCCFMPLSWLLSSASSWVLSSPQAALVSSPASCFGRAARFSTLRNHTLSGRQWERLCVSLPSWPSPTPALLSSICQRMLPSRCPAILTRSPACAALVGQRLFAKLRSNQIIRTPHICALENYSNLFHFHLRTQIPIFWIWNFVRQTNTRWCRIVK